MSDASLTLDGYQLHFACQELFETHFGVYDHEANPDKHKYPNIGSTLKPEMNAELMNPFYDDLEMFIELGVYEKTGLNLNEFLKLPVWQFDAVKEAILRSTQQETSDADKLSKELKNSFGSTK